MLSPDELERAGDLVAAAYSQIEAQMLDHLVAALLAGDALTSRDITALALLAQTHDRELHAILEANAGVVEDAVRETVETYLEASDADDMARAGGGPRWPQQVEATVAGIALVLARDNLKMVEGAKSAFLAASAEAVTKVNSGMVTTERALHQAVRKLEREGIPIITYQNRKTGTVTVENRVDVAVRRHIRTQIAQDGARMTMERMEALGVDLVEVSSHCDSRPEHRTWQGRCYSLRGDVEVEGTRYPDFYSSTGYGSVDGLMGANCRHSFGPYRHGAPRAYEPDPKHPSGLPGEEVYRLEQRQRAQERRIRAAKREVRGAQQVDDAMGTVESRAALAGARQRLTSAQAGMRSLIGGANEKSKTGARVLTRRPAREWAGDMPTAKGAKGSGRKLDEFLGGAAAARVKASGMSRTAARSAMRRELADIGLTVRQFPTLTAADQQEMLGRALQAGAINTSTRAGAKRAQAHADRYYEELRNRDGETIAATISDRTGMAKGDALRAYRHLFLDVQDLYAGRMRFPADYEIAMSAQRLIDEGRPLPHDLLLFPHENAEALLMAEGKTQREAHDEANQMYNYQEKLNEYIRQKADAGVHQDIPG